ncbi:MAG: di-trans,poly-cis-decaprenylcistransferase [Chlamydiales bacterium]|nr:di-trans,poly-cis-decaprenylcistransferase [Chlamydiales bacterium]
MSFECAVHSSFYSDEELYLVQRHPVPQHIAIIPDGNRRWARRQSCLNPMKGHWAGASIVTTILEAASDLGVKVLTVYSFSTENWKRPKLEIQTLFTIFKTYLRENRARMIEMGVRFGTIGDLTPFPQSVKDEIEKTREATTRGSTIDLVLAMNYGARDEMRRALLSMMGAIERGDLEKEEVTEEVINSYLDTAPYRDPELLIRTSGEKRISNFLLWQLAYTEVYTTEVLWPDFTPRDLMDAVLDFQKRTRRLGK